MKLRSVIGFGLLLVAMLAPLTQTAEAQDQDPPTRVARLNYLSGSVSLQPGGEGDWVTPAQNRPLTTGDNLWADKDSRAELHIGSTALRMGSETSVTFLDVDDRTTQIRLSLGSLMVTVRHLDDEDVFEMDTPNLAFTVQRTGTYRVDVNSDGNQTLVTAWQGRGQVTGGGSTFVVVAGQQASFAGTDQLDHEIAQIPAEDDLERWAFDRDLKDERADTRNYISDEMTGYEDLDDYGSWTYAAGYGTVWIPRGIAPGWAPYRFGHWIWLAPWGWTWVEDEAWGFAPFHYGRWAFVESGWCWVPGPVVVRPVYAPAFVAFVGLGEGVHLGFSLGGPGVAWFPLAPGEVYLPYYRVSREYVNVVNVTNTRVNVTQVTNVYNTYITNNTTRITYVNQRLGGAVTAVSRDTFVNARPVARNLVQVDARQMAEAPVMHESPMQPGKGSLGMAPARVRPPEGVLSRRVVATRNPPPPHSPFVTREGASVQVPNPRPAETPAHDNAGSQAAPSAMGVHSEEPRPAPRPAESTHPSELPAREEIPAGEGRSVPRPSTPPGRSWQAPHPLVKPAPAVQPGPEHQQNEQTKFRNWEQQRPKSSPPSRPPAAEPKNQKPR
ncbi:MAG TPA: DUF6600 domain-containing protein [Terriglobales bacterium]|nr:DUF6600 domain-containing protein [Terriglobales bacterium]